jgi:hypothetical protein
MVGVNPELLALARDPDRDNMTQDELLQRLRQMDSVWVPYVPGQERPGEKPVAVTDD